MGYIVLFEENVLVETVDSVGDKSRSEEILYTKQKYFDDLLEARDFANIRQDAHIIKTVDVTVTVEENK